jgi:hypothetical protein
MKLYKVEEGKQSMASLLVEPINVSDITVSTVDNKLVRIISHSNTCVVVYEVQLRFDMSHPLLVGVGTTYFYKVDTEEPFIDFSQAYDQHLSLKAETYSLSVQEQIKLPRPAGNPDQTLGILKTVIGYAGIIINDNPSVETVDSELVVEKGIRAFTGKMDDPALIIYVNKLSEDPEYPSGLNRLRQELRLEDLSNVDLIRSSSWGVSAAMLAS